MGQLVFEDDRVLLELNLTDCPCARVAGHYYASCIKDKDPELSDKLRSILNELDKEELGYK